MRRISSVRGGLVYFRLCCALVLVPTVHRPFGLKLVMSGVRCIGVDFWASTVDDSESIQSFCLLHHVSVVSRNVSLVCLISSPT